MAIHSLWQEPANPDSKEDIEAAEQSSQFMVGKIFTMFLTFPQLIILHFSLVGLHIP